VGVEREELGLADVAGSRSGVGLGPEVGDVEAELGGDVELVSAVREVASGVIFG